MGKGFYITTAIAYINSPPHIGFSYEVIAADIIARFRRLRGEKVFFLTGSDEHSLNVYRRAKEEGFSPQEYCDRMASLYQETWKKLGITYDRFIRTSSPSHKRVVQRVIQRLLDTPYIYRAKYGGWYCVSCEAFYQEKELKEGLCPVHQRKPQWVEEENYFFALSRFEDFLKEYIQENPQFIEPEERRNEVWGILNQGLQDVSISRQRAEWGIPFPGREKESVYVWVDALINYISGIGFEEEEELFQDFWPADIHLIGKDIIRFHTLLWPALLKAVDLPLPRRIFSHGFLNLRGEKISSTRGNILSPEMLLKEFPADAIRFYLFREGNFGQDRDFSLENLTERYNRELANDWGNLFQRVCGMVARFLEGKLEGKGRMGAKEREISQLAQEVYRASTTFLEDLKFSQALGEIWKLVRRVNQYIEEKAPWKLFREGRKEEVETTLYTSLEGVRVAALLLYPFVPFSSSKILDTLGIPGRWDEAREWGRLPLPLTVSLPSPIFPRKK